MSSSAIFILDVKGKVSKLDVILRLLSSIFRTVKVIMSDFKDYG